MSTGTTKSCQHYLRKCLLVSPCCNKAYACRFCHDEEQNHKLIRTDVKEIECGQCGKRQEVSQKCNNCSITFGKYFCSICCLFDDKDKGQYHCDGCGICRVGGRDKYFHCVKCDMCLSLSLQGTHKCVEKSSRNNCAICLEDLHTSTTASHVPGCGHLLHMTCFEDLMKSGGYTCPTCNQCLVNMSGIWSKMDSEILRTPMPPEYSDFEVRILCRDCHKHSKVKFHVIGLKCTECGSYNTSRDDDGNLEFNPAFVGAENQNELDMEESSDESDYSDDEIEESSDIDDETGAADVATFEEDEDQTSNVSAESDVSLD